jgi:hypothetical protein
MNDNTLKKDEHYSSRKMSTAAQERFIKRVDHKGSNWENGEKLKWV